MKIPLRIHICVVGFELDRISEAAIEQKADKVYLISQKENDEGRYFVHENQNRLKNKGIIVELKFVEKISELSDLVSGIKNIIKEEHEENIIYLNVSSGSTLSAIAGTIISMMFEKNRKIIPYYVKPKFYSENLNQIEGNDQNKIDKNQTPRSVGINEINEILTFPIRLPNEELMIVLRYLQYMEIKDKIVTKKDLIDFSNENEYLNNLRDKKRYLAGKLKDSNKNTDSDSKNETLKQQARDYAWIDQNIVNKLKDEWHLIDVKKIGKYSCIKLNDKGKKMLKYLND